MFQSLKTKNPRQSIFKNKNPFEGPYGRYGPGKSPGVTDTVVKWNDADRLVRCRHCGFICDRERDVNLKDQTWAGLGISYSAQLTAGTSIGDRRVPAAGTVVTSADQYYTREVTGGCPCCGSYLYDPKQPIIKVPEHGVENASYIKGSKNS